jgi:hypothetical protein
MCFAFYRIVKCPSLLVVEPGELRNIFNVVFNGAFAEPAKFEMIDEFLTSIRHDNLL